MIRHILLIKFKEDADPQQIDILKGLFLDMTQKVDGVEDVEWGENNSPEHKNQGYTHSVVMTFSDEAGRENYLPHPEHNALKVVFRPLIDNVIVFDYQV